MTSIKTYLILFGGVLALSASAIFVRMASAPAAVTAFYRLLLAGLALLPFFLGRKDCRRELGAFSQKQWMQIALAGFCLALHYVLWFESLGYTSIASSTVLVSLQPLFSLWLDRLLRKRRARPTALIGCAIALGGCLIIGLGDLQISGKALIGDILAFVAAGVIAFYYFVGESVRREVSAVTYSTLAYLVSAALLLGYIGLIGAPLGGYGGQTLGAFLGLALISTVGGQFVFNLLLKRLPASAVTMSILGEPIGTCILARLIFREGIEPRQLLGMLIILVGMTVFFFPKKQT